MGAQLVGIPVGPDGMDTAHLERVLERERPRFLVVTSNFQNPTGATLPLPARRALARCGARRGCPGGGKRRLRRVALSGRTPPGAQAIGRSRRRGAVAQLLEGKLSRIACRVGGGAETAGRPPAPGQGGGRPAHRSALAGGAVGIRAVRPTGGASRSACWHAGAERLAATLESCRRYLPARLPAGRSRRAA